MKEEVKKTIIPAIVKLIICLILIITAGILTKHTVSELFIFLECVVIFLSGWQFIYIFFNTFMTRAWVDRNKTE